MGRPRSSFALLSTFWIALATAAFAEEPTDADVRYGLLVDGDRYPQTSPKETLASVIKAIESDDVPYMLAHLVDSGEVDRKFKGSRKKLDGLAGKTTPAKRRKLAQLLAKHLTQGVWTSDDSSARSATQGLPDATFSRVGQRWFMHNVPTGK